MVLVDVTQPLIHLVLQDIRATDDSFKKIRYTNVIFLDGFLFRQRKYMSLQGKDYENQKTSSRLILDTHNADEYLNEHLKWEDLQIFIQRQCMENKNLIY